MALRIDTIKNNFSLSLSTLTHTLTHALLGSLFLALMSQLAFYVPFSPVPVTMQTFALPLLVVFQGRNRAIASILCYLAEATCGMPVLAGGESNPLWMVGPRAGFLIGFIAMAFMVGTLLEKRKSPSFLFLAALFLAGHALVLFMGSAWLGLFVGADAAFAMGVSPFILGTVLKSFAAAFASIPLLKKKS